MTKETRDTNLLSERFCQRLYESAPFSIPPSCHALPLTRTRFRYVHRLQASALACPSSVLLFRATHENLPKPSQYQLVLFFGLPLRIRFATLETDPQLLLAEMIFVASYLARFTLRSHLKFTRCLRKSRSTNYLWQQLISSYLWPPPE
jgi:hypothetical protein